MVTLSVDIESKVHFDYEGAKISGILACRRVRCRLVLYSHRIIDDRMENSIKGRRIGDNLH